MDFFMKEKVIIKEYSDEYRYDVINFLISVAVDEFGFEDWREYFLAADFLNLDLNENFWIAINSDNKVVGTIGISNYDDGEIAKLQCLYVSKDYRKKGIATKLLNKCIQYSLKQGYKKIILHTYYEFENAIRLYQKNGWKVDDSIESEDGIWYKKEDLLYEETFEWNNYFGNIRNKYNMRVSTKKPLIINLDGKNITKNNLFSLTSRYSNSFLDSMKKTVDFFTEKYNCLAIFGTDEVSFIIEKPLKFIKEINNKQNMRADEIVSVFSQYFFDYFCLNNANEKIYWHGECFSIPYGKVNSYIKYKSGSIKNVLTTYFLNHKNIKNAGKIPMEEKLNMCREYEDFKETEEIMNGILYYKGNQLDIDEYFKGNIKIKE
jgi:GNAT superfamily N-acetyltransferase